MPDLIIGSSSDDVPEGIEDSSSNGEDNHMYEGNPSSEESVKLVEVMTLNEARGQAQAKAESTSSSSTGGLQVQITCGELCIKETGGIERAVTTTK